MMQFNQKPNSKLPPPKGQTAHTRLVSRERSLDAESEKKVAQAKPKPDIWICIINFYNKKKKKTNPSHIPNVNE